MFVEKCKKKHFYAIIVKKFEHIEKKCIFAEHFAHTPRVQNTEY